MDYGEIKALYKFVLFIYKVLRSNNKPCSCSETSSVFFISMDVQRLSDGVGVKPQAYGGRKILALYKYRDYK